MPARKPPPKDEPMQSRVWLDLSEEERRLFEQEFADVAPLRKGSDRVVPGVAGTNSKTARDSEKRVGREDHALVVEKRDGAITGVSHGVSRETLKALARGEIRAEKTCDLHGLGVEAARHRIRQFIRDSALAGMRAVLVICGRGLHSGDQGAVLREVTVSELGSREVRAHVLAFSTASAARGGDGALAILLRRASKSE